MNTKLFKFVREPQVGIDCSAPATPDKIVGAAQVPESKSDKLVPEGGPVIDIVKDFKWTKTKRGSVGRENTPTLDLQEFYVTVPAFFSNLNVAKQVVTTATAALGSVMDSAVSIAGAGESVANVVHKAADAVVDGADRIVSEARKAFGAQESATSFNGLKYLKAYEHLYGVKRSNFIYKLPYLEDKYKTVNNNWGEGEGKLNQATQNTVNAISQAFSFAVPGVGIDYAKSFKYSDSGPRHTISFFLDNTKDSDYTGPNYETNFRLIYLLLYQNMPNKLNRLALVPPVIYRAKVPGMFSYRYCYLQSINVDMIGVRRTKTIPNFITTENNKSIEVVIPEGYEISMTLVSLVPETQNLYFDAVNNPVFSTEESSADASTINLRNPRTFVPGIDSILPPEP